MADADAEEVKIAAELMKYDVVTIGDDEFNFGKDFLLDNIAKSNINFLSANIKADKIASYIIKEIGEIIKRR